MTTTEKKAAAFKMRMERPEDDVHISGETGIVITLAATAMMTREHQPNGFGDLERVKRVQAAYEAGPNWSKVDSSAWPQES